MLSSIFRKASLHEELNSAALSMQCAAPEVILVVTHTLVEQDPLFTTHAEVIRQI
jgi:hypothetical protein